MRTTLIMFALLLVILTLLSSFGGSIRSREPFFEEIQQDVPVSVPSGDVDTVNQVGGVDEDQYQPVTQVYDSPDDVQMAPQMPSQVPVESSMVDPVTVPEPFTSDDVMTEHYASI